MQRNSIIFLLLKFNLIIQHGSNNTIKDLSNQSKIIERRKSIFINQNSNENNIVQNEFENYDNISNYSLYYDISHTKSFSYLFILNESIVIENQLPINIKCEIESNIKKQVSIRPLENKYFLDVNQDNTQLKLIVKYQKTNFVSEFFDLKLIDLNENINQNKNNKKDTEEQDIETTVKLYEEGNEINRNKFIECNIKIEQNIEKDKFIGAYEKEFEHNVKSFQKKLKLIIYNKCIIINKTDYLLYIKNEDTRERDFNTENYNGKIFPNSVNILNTKNVKNTFKLKCDNSNWSEKI